MEQVKLARIVLEFQPDLYPFLKPSELDMNIVLREGFDALNPRDALEIIQQSISEKQKGALLH